MRRRNRFVVTSAYAHSGLSDDSNWRGLRYLGSGNRQVANYIASRHRLGGGRALVHDLDTGFIVRDTGKPLGQVWAMPSRKGQRSPKETP